MSKDDYIKEATKKIYNYHEKQVVKTELASHIDERFDFYKEIGYDDDRANETATEAMGDASLVCDDFGRLHNSSQNPLPDIILFVFLAAVHVGGWWALKTYAFYDSGLISSLLGAIFISVALVYLFSSYTARRVNIVSKLLNVLVIGGAAYFNFIIMKALGGRSNSSLSELFAFLKECTLPRISNYPDKKTIIIIICAAMSVAAVAFSVMLVYYVKVKLLRNKLIDNRLSRAFYNITLYLSIPILLVGILLCAKSYFDIKTLQNEYLDAYKLVLSVAEECNSGDEIEDAFKEKGITFEEFIHSNTVEEYRYQHNLVNIFLSYENPAEKAYAAYNDTEYEGSEAYCKIIFNMNTAYFESKYTKLTTKFVMINGEREDEFHSYIPNTYYNNEYTDDRELEFYENYCPISLVILYGDSVLAYCDYSFQYLIGNENYKYTLNRSAFKGSSDFYEYIVFRDALNSALRENPDASPDELASITDSEIIEEDFMSKETVRQMLLEMGYSEEEVDSVLDEFYNYLMKKYEKLNENKINLKHGVIYASVYKNEESGTVSVTYKSKPDDGETEVPTEKFFDFYTDILDEKIHANVTRYEDNLKVVAVNGAYFDKNGLYYDEAEQIAYYTSDGTRYYFYRKTIEDPTHTVGNTYEYYLTDRDTKFVKADLCFIDKDGYLVIDSHGMIKYDDDSKAFKDSGGNIYHKALETSWDEDGNQIFQSDEEDSLW